MILDWPVRTGLLAYRDRLRAEAAEEYRAERLIYALGALKKPPTLDPILSD